jgi:energy-coupling factor transport system ATP-binding protein
VTATAVTVRRRDRVAVAGASLSLHAGERVALVGPNGAGKSSLLMALATGTGGAPAAPRGTVALVPDASDDLFVRDSVGAECRRADRRAGRAEGTREGTTRGTTAARFADLLGVTDPADAARLLARHPRDLSAGERRCLAIALQTAHAPRALLVDEPTRGLDPAARDLVLRALEAQADAGAAVLIATHDAEFAAALADRTLEIRDGVLAPAVRVASSVAAPVSVGAPGDPRGTGGTEHGSPPPARRIPAPAPPRPQIAPPYAAPGMRTRTGWRTTGLIAANLAAAAAFLWPLVASAVPAQAQAAVPYIALSLAPLAVVLVLAALDASVRSAHTLALLAVLAAIGAAIRIASTGVGGVEALFVLLILAGRAYGARFGLLLGAAAIAVSAVMWGGVGPWLPFQMFACGWVGAGAGLLPRRVRGWAEVAMLCVYGVVASYLFGLVMNMWFWPFAVGSDTSISYVPGGSVGENLANFLVYSFVTSTATWDTLRAVTTVVGLTVVGAAVLSALRRAKPSARDRAALDRAA